MQSTTVEEVSEPRRIRAVVQQTGLSKELIHHYLRQGLLPKSRKRARYSEQQVRLLRQIRTLREDHNLPLDVIRELFAVFDFDPARIEALTLSDSLGKRVSEFAAHGELLSGKTLSADELVAEAGISAERLADYLQARLIEPLEGHAEQRFGVYDAKVIALCEHGLELGIPFDAFRTIASYVRIAFELEHRVFYGMPTGSRLDADIILAELFVRREVASSFVQNVLTALTQRRMRSLLDEPGVARVTLDDVIYRPSPMFVRVHQLDDRIERARVRVREQPDAPQLRLHAAELMLHAGRHEEATFFLGECVDKWPADTALRCSFGRASLLVGDTERAAEQLRQVVDSGAEPARSSALLALCLFSQAHADDRPEVLIRNAVPILQQIERALDGAADGGGSGAVEAAMLCGWLLTALPPVFAAHTADKGIGVLVDAFHAAMKQQPGDDAEGRDQAVAGYADRLRINAAYLLFESLKRAAHSKPPASQPSLSELRALICRLDPGCTFAESVFLNGTEPNVDATADPRSLAGS